MIANVIQQYQKLKENICTPNRLKVFFLFFGKDLVPEYLLIQFKMVPQTATKIINVYFPFHAGDKISNNPLMCMISDYELNILGPAYRIKRRTICHQACSALNLIQSQHSAHTTFRSTSPQTTCHNNIQERFTYHTCISSHGSLRSTGPVGSIMLTSKRAEHSPPQGTPKTLSHGCF